MSGHDGLYQSWIISKSLNWNPGKDLISLTKQIKLRLSELAANITRLGSSRAATEKVLYENLYWRWRWEGGKGFPKSNVQCRKSNGPIKNIRFSFLPAARALVITTLNIDVQSNTVTQTQHKCTAHCQIWQILDFATNGTMLYLFNLS